MLDGMDKLEFIQEVSLATNDDRIYGKMSTDFKKGFGMLEVME